ncbi:asialoglycoprotein receptor 1-like isoform X2 [Pseudoliparis swirei]|uniref:asialoglycoprotein receptor 1-like isoform X2 n=1 Tax=Pseudoliparis swirei TaxID=2059687 RepID=UPI0024BDC633|nr:asialoglycoprotein receptor 1-like isoform X2 [Pseudoliparis swirei]
MNTSPPDGTEEVPEEADYVNEAVRSVEPVAAAPDRRFLFFSRSPLVIAACWLVLVLILGLRLHFTSVISENDAKLKADNLNLKTQNQDLKRQRNTIQDMETNWTELNISRAQWSIDTYCIHNAEGKCEACRKGWSLNQKSCYVTINPNPPGGKTWTEAREYCRERNADFPVVLTEDGKNIIDKYSYGDVGDWIGLRVEDGKWKWIDGTELNQTSWNGPPVDGHCAVSTQGEGWSSVSCDLRKQWICVQDALSV